MARETSVQVASTSRPKNYTVTITAIPPVAFAVPGVRKVANGDTIVFHNRTGGPVKISVAADKVLKGVKALEPKLVNNGKKRSFLVEAQDGTHELSVHYSYWDKQKKKRRTGFAVGASSPKIIIIKPQ